MAVINNKLLAEGDAILEFSVFKIEGDQVWVTGPNGREALSFSFPVPALEDPEEKVVLESSP